MKNSVLGTMNRYGKKKRFIKKIRNDSDGDEERELEREKERQVVSVCLRCGWEFCNGINWIWRGEGLGSHKNVYCAHCATLWSVRTAIDFGICLTGLYPSGAPHPYFGG